MNKIVTGAAFLCLVAHVLIAVSIASNYWLRFVDAGAAPVPLNPVVNDTGIPDREVTYRGRNVGVWVACYSLQTEDKVSCGFIDRTCGARICWIREHESDPKLNKLTCKRQIVSALVGKCTAFQVTRAFAVTATFFSILATTFLFVSLCVMAHIFATWGGVFALVSALSGLIAFAVFLGAVVNAQSLSPTVAKTGWSYALHIAGWVIVLLAGVLAFLGANTDGSSKEEALENDDVYESA